MSNQIYEIENQESFELEDIFECGQCFRWNKQADGSYIGVAKGAVIKVKKEGNKIAFSGKTAESDKSDKSNNSKDSKENKNFENLIRDYFDLDRNYDNLKEKLSKIDDNLKIATKFGSGIRILNQDLWECIISFIISANNNIPRIKKIIEKLSLNYGEKISWNEEDYYSFPTPESLSKASVEDLRNMGLGFRDIRVFNTTQKVLSKQFDIDELKKIKDTNEMRERLLELDGVGPKVADCILLFSMKRFDVFPIDVWVRRVINELYIHNEDEQKVSKREIEKLAKEKFLGYEGLAQQYLFYHRRSG